MAQYVDHVFIRPATWQSKADEDGWPAHVEAVLRNDAVNTGVSVIGAPEQVGDAQQIMVDADTGPVRALRVTYRAAVSEPVDITTVTVDATEKAPGVWEADVPGGAAIVSIRHGLNTLAVDVDAFDADGQPSGYRGFPVPVSRQEVEIVPGATARRLVVTVVPEDEEGGEQAPDDAADPGLQAP